MAIDSVTFGKLALAVASFPLWEIGIVGAFKAINDNHIRFEGKMEKVPFLPRFYMAVGCMSSLVAALWMVYPVASMLGIIK